MDDGWALIKIDQVPDKPGVAAAIFGAIADAGISVDLILQNAGEHQIADLSFTVRVADLPKARGCLETIQAAANAKAIHTLEDLAKVELVGTGILTDPAYVGRMFRVLADAGINILAIGTSEIRISCLVHRADRQRAGEALSAAFQVNAAL